MKKSLQMASFDCDRTCPAHEVAVGGQFFCRFRPILDLLGPVKVNSHTARITVEYHKHIPGLKAAVEVMGGTWLGEGVHHLFSSHHSGHGFKLPGWQHTLVVDANGQLHYDDYNGMWGKVSDLDRLKGCFAIQSAQITAQTLGWQTEMVGKSLIVHHPEGGRLEINKDNISTSGFTGGACHTAREALGLAVTDVTNTAEHCEEVLKIKEST